MDQAEAYCRLAKVAIGMAMNRADLTAWWRGQTLTRHRLRLSQEQIDDLALAARDRSDFLTGGSSRPHSGTEAA